MKNTIKYYFPTVLLFAFICINLSSCLKDECTEERNFLEYRSLFVKAEEFRIDPSFESSKVLKNTGKIYFYQDYIFINERNEGIHIIDNSNPLQPDNIGFINIPGNVDIAIKGTTLYADNYADLLTIDISNFQQPTLLCRDEDVFSSYWIDPQRGYYVGVEATGRTMTLDCSDPNFGDNTFNRNGFILFNEDANISTGAPTALNNNGSTGVGGSFARFTIRNNFLYVINQQELIPYDVSGSNCPDRGEITYVSWGIETLFPYKQYLFIGANNGMYIYDATVPSQPQYVSEFRHANSCDPVFVQDDIAYVTLRNGTNCQNFINELNILDVSDIRSPELIKSYDMEHPHGLSVSGNKLYLCEGAYGLKVFETDDLKNIDDHKIDHIKNIHAYDAISLSLEHLLVIGKDGLYQYDTSNPSNLSEMSFISVEK